MSQIIEIEINDFIHKNFNLKQLYKFKINRFAIKTQSGKFIYDLFEYNHCILKNDYIMYSSMKEIYNIKNFMIDYIEKRKDNPTKQIIDLDSDFELNRLLAKTLIEHNYIEGKIIIELSISLKDFEQYLRNR